MTLTKNELEKQLEQMIQKRSVKDPDASTYTLLAHARAADKTKQNEVPDKTHRSVLLIPTIT